MGKKRSCTDVEHQVALKKFKDNDHDPTKRSKDGHGDREKSGRKHLKKARHKAKYKSKHKKKKSKKNYTDSSSSDDSSSTASTSASSASTSSDSGRDHKRRIKKKKRKHKRSKLKKVKNEKEETLEHIDDSACIGPLPPESSTKIAKSMAPMTKEEWEKRQSVVRRVYDEETGRHRLIKGDGEVLEEIVSRDRHKEINRLATKEDGSFFENTVQNKFKCNNP